MDFTQLRQKYPEYNDMSDEEFASSFHKKFYSDIPYDQFQAKIGLSASTNEQTQESEKAAQWYKDAWDNHTKGGPVESLLREVGGVGSGIVDAAQGLIKMPLSVGLGIGYQTLYGQGKYTNDELRKLAQQDVEHILPSVGPATHTEDALAYKYNPLLWLGNKITEGQDKVLSNIEDPQMRGTIGTLTDLGLIAGAEPLRGGVVAVKNKVGKALDSRKTVPQKVNVDEVLDQYQPKAIENPPYNPENPIPWQNRQFDLATARDAAEIKQNASEAHQVPLFDQPEQGRVANPYEANIGEWRVDENGIPIRADLSMEAQHVQEPLQRQLWGEELGQRVNPIGQAATLEEGVRQYHEQPVQGGIPLTQALDSMSPEARSDAIGRLLRGEIPASGELKSAIAESRSPFEGLGKEQAGVINMKMFDDTFQQIKEINNGIKLVLQGRSKIGPVITAYDRSGTPVGELRLAPQDYPFSKASPKGNLEAGWVTTDPGKLTSKSDASRLAPTTKSQYPGLATEMYKFAAEAGNDIVRSEAQTPEGQAMWNRFENKGISQNGMIRAQRGAVNFNEVSDAIKKLFDSPTAPRNLEWNKMPKPDTTLAPVSPESIAKKTKLSEKAQALGLKDTPYNRVTTREEALSHLPEQKDLLKVSPDSLRSGTGAVVRTNPKNKVMNYVRNIFQEGRNQEEALSKQYVTAPKTGVVATVKAMSKQEQVDLAGKILAISKRRLKYTSELADALQLTPAQRTAAEAIFKGLEARYASMADSLQSLGFMPPEPLESYLPAMFSGSYTSFIGHYKDGHFITTGIAQADTLFGYRKAVNKYKSMGPEYAAEIRIPKKELRTNGGVTSHLYNGFNDLVSQLSLADPKFGEVKKIVDQHAADEVRALYRFDIHELKKSGVQGSLGDRPWLSAEKNSRDLYNAITDYLEQGFRYDSMLKPLHELEAITSDPMVGEHLPNTVRYLNQYKGHIKGTNFHPVQAITNWAVNMASPGFSPAVWRRSVQEVSKLSATWMMGMGNLGFAAMQLTQYGTAAIPEAMAMAKTVGLDIKEVAHSSTTSGLYTSALALGKDDVVPSHMKEAYQWGHDHGLFQYSEAELAHEIHKSNTRIAVEGVANFSITAPEKMTRGPAFMMFADLFHKAGYVGEDALLRAQEATNASMIDYHPDERPMLYSSLGMTGQMLGALTTYKHGFIEQNLARGVNIKRAPEAALVTLGIAAGLYGLGGMPGYQEASQLSEKLTGKSLREWMLSDPTKPNVGMDGLASWYWDTDIQSRLSQSSLFPDSPLSAAPHVAKTWDVLSKAYEAGIYKDTASMRSLTQAALPTSLQNVYEDKVLTDENGWVRNPKGLLKTEEPRTEEERRIRRLTGMVPLRERLQRETLWTQQQRRTENQKELKDLSERFKLAVINGDKIDSIVKKYTDLGGDPNQLFNSITQDMLQGSMTPKERAQGVPNNSMSSMKRYQDYNPIPTK